MTYSVLIAAPLLIAAIVMAFRFVGCTQDFDQFEPHGGGDENGKPKVEKVYAKASLSGSGQLSVTAVVQHDPEPTEFFPQGAYTYDIPPWCIYIDLVLLGGGGGGSTVFPVGNGGKCGSWNVVTLWRDSGEPQPDPDLVPIPAATTSISITVGSGGGGGPTPAPGGDTVATATGMTDQIASGGAAGANSDATGTGPFPPNQPFNGTTADGGADQTTANGQGNAPGGGGAGGFFPGGGAGADGKAWVLARQT
jgi:hypothetical protein